jgi:hypothetical protein
MHGILMLHDEIRHGEIMKRRNKQRGAEIHVDQVDGTPSTVQPVTLSRSA